MRAWKIILLSAVAITAIWLLSPMRSVPTREPGVLEINFLWPGGPTSGALDDQIKVFERESYEAHQKDPDHPVYRVISGQTASRDMVADPTRFLLSVAGGTPPDVIFFFRAMVTELAARGAFTPLDSFVRYDLQTNHPDAVIPEDFFEACWEESHFTDLVSGKKALYGIPTQMDTRALFYNKDLLKRGGFVDEKGEARPPRTWEELETMAVKLTERNASGRLERVGFIPKFYYGANLMLYGWMNGGEFLSPDGRLCTLNDPRNVDALQWMVNLYDKMGGAKDLYAFQSSFQFGDLDPFINGKIAMKIDGYWMLNSTVQYGRNLNWGMAPPPMPAAELAKGRTTLSWTGGWCFSMPSTAKQKKAGWELIRFLTSERACRILNESQRVTNASQGRPFIPDQHPNRRFHNYLFQNFIQNNSMLDSNRIHDINVLNDLIDVSRFRPVTPVGGLLWDEQQTATENAIFHKMSPKEALDNGTVNVQQKLDQFIHPPQGPKIPWNLFLWVYGALLVAAALFLYLWDTRAEARHRLVSKIPLIGKSLAGLGGDAEGANTPFMRRRWRDGWICALPWILGFVIFTGGPILFSIIISFSTYDVLNDARFVGLANYKWLFTGDPLFWKSLLNTVFMGLGIPLGMAASLGLALLLNQKVRGVAVWRTFFYLPAIIPIVASSILWVWIFNPNIGLINNILATLGITGPNWLQDENTSKLALIIMGIWSSGASMIIWLAGLKGINKFYYEAASLDGANTWQQFLHVTLPMLSPYILFNLIMGLIGTFQIFTQAFVMTAGGPVNSTLFYVYHLFNSAFRYLQMGYAAAMAWFLFFIVLGLTLLQMKLSRKWVHYEGQ